MMKNAVTWLGIVWLILGPGCYGQQRSSIETGTVVLKVVDNCGNPVIPTEIRIVNQLGMERVGFVVHHVTGSHYILKNPGRTGWLYD
jgi:hypothetical protein